MNILFVDDDELRTRPLRVSLNSIDHHEVIFIQNPEEAKKEFEKRCKDIDLAIVDIMLPHYGVPAYRDFSIPKYFPSNHDGMFTGLKLAVELTEIMKRQKHIIPLIILSCIYNIELYNKEIALKPTSILVKPILLANFLEEVKNAGNQR